MLKSFGHSHIYLLSLGWTVNSLSAPRPGVEHEPCEPYLASWSLVLLPWCAQWHSVQSLKSELIATIHKWGFEYVQILLKLQQVWQGGTFILHGLSTQLSNGWHLLSTSLHLSTVSLSLRPRSAVVILCQVHFTHLNDLSGLYRPESL